MSRWIAARSAPDPDGHQVAIPRTELFELRQELLPFGAATGALHTLLRVARTQLEIRDPGLLVAARLCSTPLGVVEQSGSSILGVERLRAIHGPRLVDQSIAPYGGGRVEQTLHAIDAAGGDSGKRRPSLLVELRGPRIHEVADRPLREPVERHELAAREDRPRQRPEVVGDQHDHGVRWRLLEVLQERVRRILVQQVRTVNEIDTPVCFERPHVQVAPELADRVDSDHLAERVQFVEIRVELARGAEQGVPERTRDLPLAHPRRTMEQIGMGRPFAQRGIEQPRGLGVLREARGCAHEPPRLSARPDAHRPAR